MTLITDWKKSLSFYCMQAMAACASMQVAYLAMPAEAKATIPSNTLQYATIGVLVLGMVGRILSQDPVTTATTTAPDGTVTTVTTDNALTVSGVKSTYDKVMGAIKAITQLWNSSKTATASTAATTTTDATSKAPDATSK
jgi:hypothetical protein